jgi:uncharacterized protein (TIGR02145 family)
MDAITFSFTGSGANTTDTLSSDAKGWFFQWGRPADGHQWRRSDTVTGPASITNTTGVITAAKFAGKFIKSDINNVYDWRKPQYDYAWRNWPDGRFPCPTGWRIPSSSEWESIYRSSWGYGTADDATSNTWTWIDKGAGTNGGRGYVIKPDGITSTLFLPGAGYRDTNGAIANVGSLGVYWSSTTASGGAYRLVFSSIRVSPELSHPRAHGMSVRCLAE